MSLQNNIVLKGLLEIVWSNPMKSMARSGHSEPCLVVLGLSLRVEIPKTDWPALSSLVPTLAQGKSYPLVQAAREDIKQYWPWWQLLESITGSSQMDLGLLSTALGLCWSGRFCTNFTVSFFKYIPPVWL